MYWTFWNYCKNNSDYWNNYYLCNSFIDSCDLCNVTRMNQILSFLPHPWTKNLYRLNFSVINLCWMTPPCGCGWILCLGEKKKDKVIRYRMSSSSSYKKLLLKEYNPSIIPSLCMYVYKYVGAELHFILFSHPFGHIREGHDYFGHEQD